jgi:hypothetical protein
VHRFFDEVARAARSAATVTLLLDCSATSQPEEVARDVSVDTVGGVGNHSAVGGLNGAQNP